MLFIPEMATKSAKDGALDTLRTGQGNRFQVTELGEINKAIFDEWKSLYTKYPGFIGFYILRASGAENCSVDRVPFGIYKNHYEGLVDQGQLAIENVWREPFAQVHDCWTVASGATFYAKNGGVNAPINMFNTALHNFVLQNRML